MKKLERRNIIQDLEKSYNETIEDVLKAEEESKPGLTLKELLSGVKVANKWKAKIRKPYKPTVSASLSNEIKKVQADFDIVKEDIRKEYNVSKTATLPPQYTRPLIVRELPLSEIPAEGFPDVPRTKPVRPSSAPGASANFRVSASRLRTTDVEKPSTPKRPSSQSRYGSLWYIKANAWAEVENSKRKVVVSGTPIYDGSTSRYDDSYDAYIHKLLISKEFKEFLVEHNYRVPRYLEKVKVESARVHNKNT